jgi:hypothetical protein
MQNQPRIYNHSKFGAFLHAFRQNPTQQGLRASLYATIDNLRHFSGPPDIIATASALSLIVLKMDWALQKGDQATVDACRQMIEDHAEHWARRTDAPVDAPASEGKPASRKKRLH